METKRLKKNNETWIKAKSLPIRRGMKQKAQLPLYLKPHKRGNKKIEKIKQNGRKSLGNQPKSKNV